MIAIEFVRDRGPRAKGDVVNYDEASAAAIVAEGAAKYVAAPDAAALLEPEPEPEPDKPTRSRRSKPAEAGD
ncbi:hypothetical protein [Rhodococcus sp. PD04]|uniref:hypothetical protein n=1 Tax=Rhodococcus sp. PD04 TaxID=3109594 RepID=UPI002DD7A5C1|nr:hypothetical protein [Rhodococcus sp. PD04]WSE22325.1 hypothetical protein U9J23_22165 [Rhodococcus sp. PD04]